VLAPQELLKFVSSSLSAYCENTAGFLTVGHATIFCDCVLAPQELLKFVSSSLSAYCENTAGFLTVGHATIFCVSLQRLSLAIDKTQHVGVNLHICGFQPTVGLQ